MKEKTMLSKLLAGISSKPAQVAEVAEVAESALSVEFSAYKESAEKQVLELTAAVTQAASKIEELQAALELATASLASEREVAKATKLAVRKEKIAAAVGDERVDALMAATASMDDAGFNSIVDALTLSVDAESKSKMFTEQGATVSASAVEVNQDADGAVMAALKQMLAKGLSASSF